MAGAAAMAKEAVVRRTVRRRKRVRRRGGEGGCSEEGVLGLGLWVGFGGVEEERGEE